MTGMLILWSRNAQDKNVLVRRAQWDQARVPFPGRRNKRAWEKRERADWMCSCAHAPRGRGKDQEGAAWCPPCSRNAHKRGSTRLPLKREREASLERLFPNMKGGKDEAEWSN